MESGQEETNKECCGQSSGGSQKGCRKSCCGAKVLGVFLLFLVGGIIGYLLGSHCSSSRYGACKMGMMASHCPSQVAGKQISLVIGASGLTPGTLDGSIRMMEFDNNRRSDGWVDQWLIVYVASVGVLCEVLRSRNPALSVQKAVAGNHLQEFVVFAP